MEENRAEYPALRRSRTRLERPRQTRGIHFRLFAHELETLQNRAKLANKSLSAFLRDTLFAPNDSQSPAIPSPIQHPSENLNSENRHGEEQTFSSRALQEKKMGSDLGLKTGGVCVKNDTISERTGHAPACECFACARLRGILDASSTTIGSGKKPRKT